MARTPIEQVLNAGQLIATDSREDHSRELRAECVARVLGAALERDFFNVKELAQQADVPARDVKRVLSDYRDAFEDVFRPRYLLKGEWFLGSRIRPERRDYISRRIEQLIPGELKWLNPARTNSSDLAYLETLASAEENLRALGAACSPIMAPKDRIVGLWDSVVSDLEIARQEITDNVARDEQPKAETSSRMLAMLSEVKDLTDRFGLVERVFDGSGSPGRRLSRLEYTIGSFSSMKSGLTSKEWDELTFLGDRPRQREDGVSRRLVIKRAFDICIASAMLVLASPVLAIIAVAIKLESPGPLMFRQRRRGLGGRVFTIWKFRTMTVLDQGSVVMQATRNDARVTRIGQFLRRLNLDELPQLFNVLKGEMSLVGPRANSLAHDDHFEQLLEGYSNRYLFKPGITGWAQVNAYGSEIFKVEDLQTRHHYDLYYMQNWSLWLDIRIMVRTLMTTSPYRNAI